MIPINKEEKIAKIALIIIVSIIAIGAFIYAKNIF